MKQRICWRGSAWLLQEKCSHVGMESTGVYWVQAYRRLEGFFELVVANAQHIKAVRGAKNGCAGRRMDCGTVRSMGS
jgi:hypothetical protein